MMTRQFRAASTLPVVVLLELVLRSVLICIPYVQSIENGNTATNVQNHSTAATLPNVRPLPFSPNIGPLLLLALPGYWEQNPDVVDSEQCPYFRSVPDDVLSLQEKDVA
jgi:hypothetical protein